MLSYPGEPEAFISSNRSLMGSQARKDIIGTKRFNKKSMELPLSSEGYKVNKALLAQCLFLLYSSVHFSLAVFFEF